MADLLEEELAKRLSLYQGFLRLYERNTALIDDLLQSEDQYQPTEKEFTQLYLQGVVDESETYITTNLSTGNTQKLLQPQQIWTIGRDNNNGICIADPYLSNRHGAIQYIPERRNFYLIDFSSTNGSYVNGEPIYQPTKLKDGDCIRLGKLSFSFFVNHNTKVLPSVAVELLMQLIPRVDNRNGDENQVLSASSKGKILSDAEATLEMIKTPDKINHVDRRKSHQSSHQSMYQQRSDILDKFFNRHNRQIPNNFS
ncbi:MAG: FHA domain-containing protein [Calothrix sp. MO_167.B42]|nr:FHA domain-containing protein [Calothrix sp. MO_167.B42]